MRYTFIGLGLVVTVALVVLTAPAIQAWLTIVSMRQLESELKMPPSDVTLSATAVGCHWHYTHETPGGRIEIDPAKTPCTTELCRMGLDPDKAAVVPVGKTVKVDVASLADEPRDFAVPALGVRLEIVPGQLRETWFKALKPGFYSGQAAGRCAKDPSRIGIGIRAVDDKEWLAWIARSGGIQQRGRAN